MDKILNGTDCAQKIYNQLHRKIQAMSIKPTLAVILVGNDAASRLYVQIKEKACQTIGINFKKYLLPTSATKEQLLDLINKLNANKKITGIIVQLPLPKKIDANKIIFSIEPEKDVDGLNPINIAKILAGLPAKSAPTADGILELLRQYKINLSGKHIVLVGYGRLVGKPLANMIAVSNSNATLTICTKQTKNLNFYTKQADILISATGQGHLIKAEMIKKGAVVIDAGVSTIGGKMVGDVDFENVKNKCSYITPPQGGVGPMTVAMLLKNLII